MLVMRASEEKNVYPEENNCYETYFRSSNFKDNEWIGYDNESSIIENSLYDKKLIYTEEDMS